MTIIITNIIIVIIISSSSIIVIIIIIMSSTLTTANQKHYGFLFTRFMVWANFEATNSVLLKANNEMEEEIKWMGWIGMEWDRISIVLFRFH